jgi:transposase
MSTTLNSHASITSVAGLYLAFELDRSHWLLAFSAGGAGQPRRRRLDAGDLQGLHAEITRAKARFGLPADAPVYSCYEAGRDGFWLDRYLRQHGIHNLVVDSSSIEVDRRRRRAKTDGIDVAGLLDLLRRHHAGGDKKPWRVVHVPSVADEDRRQLHRDLLELQRERTRHRNRIRGLLTTQGLTTALRDLPGELAALKTWDGQAVPAGLQERLLREWQRLQLVEQQIATLETQRQQAFATATEPSVVMARQLLWLRGIGPNSAWLFAMELFGWRDIQNRRQLGALTGLTPTPYSSGGSQREQGISKAGNRRIRAMAVEIAWLWLRYQPKSELSQWYRQRFGTGAKRLRRIGIVAMTRKLVVQLWRYLKTGELPPGAELAPYKQVGKSRLKRPA